MVRQLLAYLLHAFGRDEEASEVCRFLAQYQFTGTYRLWSSVSSALVLQARLSRQRSQASEAADCIRRIHEVGFIDSRLKGDMLDPNSLLRLALEAGDEVRERYGRLDLLRELCFMIELGGSKRCPIPSLEKAYPANVARLRELTGADEAAAQAGSPSSVPSRRRGPGVHDSASSTSNLPTQRSRPARTVGRGGRRASRQ